MNFDNDIENCLRVLREGGIILYPTDTVWGIGCDATNEKAVEKIYTVKKRNATKGKLYSLLYTWPMPSPESLVMA